MLLGSQVITPVKAIAYVNRRSTPAIVPLNQCSIVYYWGSLVIAFYIYATSARNPYVRACQKLGLSVQRIPPWMRC